MNDKKLTAEQREELREEQRRWDQLVAMVVGPKLVGDDAEQLRSATNLAMAALRAAGRADLAEQLAA